MVNSAATADVIDMPLAQATHAWAVYGRRCEGNRMVITARIRRTWQRVSQLVLWGTVGLVCGLVGCGTTREHRATDQLLLSDAVDRSVAHLDFRPFTGEKVFLDTRFLIQQPPDPNLVNANYVISSIRQQMFAYGCLVQEKEDTADYVIEARLGTLGSDGHEVNFGIPASNALGAAATAITSTPAIPAIPEISFARRTEASAASKIGLFAYRRSTKEPVWQSGLSVGRSNANGRWVLGIGPFQSGSIYDGTLFAGENVKTNRGLESHEEFEQREEQAFRQTAMYDEGLHKKLSPSRESSPASPHAPSDREVQLAHHEEPAPLPAPVEAKPAP